MEVIHDIRAREILDSRGNPTVEVILNGAVASVPSGASTGIHEALELRDGGKPYLGEGVQKAVRHVNKIIAPRLKRKSFSLQREFDNSLLQLDGTKNKTRLGANALLGVSLAYARASCGKKPLFAHLHSLLKIKRKMRMPRPLFNIINGGKHADSSLKFQEFMIVPRLRTFKENLRAGSEIYHRLKKDIHAKYGKSSTNVGDEGGFVPPLQKTEEVLKLLVKAINDAGYRGKVDLAIDCAASEFYRKGKYIVDKKKLSREQLFSYYRLLVKKYPIISLEDPFQQEDFEGFALLRKKLGIQIVGDDLTVTTVARIKKAIKYHSCNCLLLKVNQVGTLTEALAAAELAFSSGWKVMVSHRSGETEDTFIADLAVALGCGMIKAGAPCRGERVAKYNRLLKIEEEMKKV